MANLRALWRGELPLQQAFWTWVIAAGLIVNITTTALFLVLVMNGHPWPALVAGYAFSVPYNIVAVVGVWRAAARYTGPKLHASLARGASLAIMSLLSLT